MQTQVEASSNESSIKNLSLGRILMAIDNLHSRCEEGIRRIKEEAKRETEKGDRAQQEKKKQEEAKTRKDKEIKDKKDLTPQQDEDDYIRKGIFIIFFL